MAKFSSHAICPECKTRRMQRVERKPWMRHLPSSKLYQCKDCGARVFYVNRWLKWRMSSVSTRPIFQQQKGSSRRSSRYAHIIRSLLYLRDEELRQLKTDIDAVLQERRSAVDPAMLDEDIPLELREIDK